ncbi:RusA family crossover junction endodeoxyribonuclease [Nocardia sp. NPDC049149]|uniref:RusA family crossover junction endodeoxyribonuclease n=1 Tax=Nocardia sp. NPDC049149 TaxID=3364315 RepID=UPI0037239001
MTRSYRCFVPGIPAPQGSKRHVGKGRMVESSKELGPWRAQVALAVHSLGWPLHEGAVGVDLMFVMPRPKSTPKSKTPPATRRPDADKLARAILDAVTGVVFSDDSQVIDLRSRKRLARIGEVPGVAIHIFEPEEDL